MQHELDNLIDKLCSVDHSLKRNIVSLRISENLFDDLCDSDEDAQLIMQQEMEFRHSQCESNQTTRAFHYSTAIEYPFASDNFMHNRFSDGTFATWYGSFEFDTCIHETAYWMVKDIDNIIDPPVTIFQRQRAVYDVHCQAYAVALDHHASNHPELTSDDYRLCQMIGAKLSTQGYPAIVYRSARHPQHNNLVAFTQQILSHPKLYCYLDYHFDLHSRLFTVCREPNQPLLSLQF